MARFFSHLKSRAQQGPSVDFTYNLSIQLSSSASYPFARSILNEQLKDLRADFEVWLDNVRASELS